MGKINFKNYGHQKNWISGSYVDSISTKKKKYDFPRFERPRSTAPVKPMFLELGV